MSLRRGTIARTNTIGDGLDIDRYWQQPDGQVDREGITLMFADKEEFTAFLRAVERYGRKAGYLPTRQRKERVSE